MGASDEELMRRVMSGDRVAFTELVGRYRGRIMRLAYGIVRNRSAAEDIVQETFTRVWVRACDWDPTRGGRFVAWVSRIATNLALDSRRRPEHAALDETDDPPSDRPDAEAVTLGREIRRRIDAALAKLPLRQRTAFVLCQFEELSNAEAAASMGVGLGTLEQLLVRARRTVRRELADLVEV